MRFLTIDNDKHRGIELTRVGDDYWILCGKGETRVGVPASPFVSAGLDELDQQEGTMTRVFHSGEIVGRDGTEGPVLLPSREERKGGRRPKEHVLLLVNTPAGVRLTQATYDQEVVGDEVVHQYLEFAEDVAPPGIHVWATSGDQWLLELIPNASFRIEFPNMVLVVRWSGIPDPPADKRNPQIKIPNGGLALRSFDVRLERHQRSALG